MNRHLKIAFIVAPFLSIGGYALVDQYQHYQLQKQARALFPLEVDGECSLRPGGDCRLRGASLELRLRQGGGDAGGDLVLIVESSQPLSGGKLGYGPVSEKLPQRTLRQDVDARRWRVAIPRSAIDASGRLALRMVVISGGRVHIAELVARVQPSLHGRLSVERLQVGPNLFDRIVDL